MAIKKEVSLCLGLYPRRISTPQLQHLFVTTRHNQSKEWLRCLWGSGADVPYFGLKMVLEAAEKDKVLKHLTLSLKSSNSTYLCIIGNLFFFVTATSSKGSVRNQPAEVQVLGEEHQMWTVSSLHELIRWAQWLPKKTWLYKLIRNQSERRGWPNQCWSRTTLAWKTVLLGCI